MGLEDVSVLDALDRSVAEAVRSGRLDAAAQAGPVAAARRVAALMDEPGWPMICVREDGTGGKLDNVSPGILLKYCEALGLCPDLSASDRKRAKSGVERLRADLAVVGGRGARAS